MSLRTIIELYIAASTADNIHQYGYGEKPIPDITEKR